MCGIAGLFHFRGRPVSAARLTAMTEVIAHRGRDGAAVWLGGPQVDWAAYPGIGLGHRRLSVIDLQAQSAQPMRSASGRQSIVYNGELYNYKPLREELSLNHGYPFRT